MSEEFGDWDLELTTLSAHVRYASQEAVVEALARLEVGRGAAVPVMPPRRLPYGLFVSPVRNGWVSIWNPLESTREWFGPLTATLECPGVVLEVIESAFWIADFLQDGRLVGRVELPTAAVEEDLLRARVLEGLKAADILAPWQDESLLEARMEEAADSPEFQEDLRQLRESRPSREALRPFLPAHADLDRAWELLTAIDRHASESEAAEGEDPFAEEYLEDFAAYLGIRDAAWDPQADADAFAAGDYEEEEGLPEGWREFVMLPVPQLRVL